MSAPAASLAAASAARRMIQTSIVTMTLAALLAACAATPGAPPAIARTAERDAGIPFLGIGLGDDARGGALVLGTVAGPAAAAGLRRGDRIIAIDGVPVDGQGARERLAASRPGTRFQLRGMRGETPFDVELVVAERSQWLGPIAFPAAVPFAAAATTADWPDPVVDAALAQAPALAPISARLDAMFDQLARDDRGFHKLPRLRAALTQPGQMAYWRAELADALRPPTRDGRAIVDALCDTLALACPAPRADDDAPQSLPAFAATIAAANRRVREIFRGAGLDRAQAADDLDYLMRRSAEDRTLLNQPGVERGIRAMQASMKLDLAALLAVFDRLLENARRLPVAAREPIAVPAALAARVQGDVLAYAEADGGYVVIGGPGPNRYDMTGLFAVIDVGGADSYEWRGGVPAETQTLIDFGGDDRYEAARAGPGAGWLGAALLIDLGGNDHYVSAIGGCGAGAFGFGLLVDAGGSDRYDCAAWSIGAALYGGGVLIDAGVAADVYLSQSFAQGVGGPRGAGFLLDEGGADLYRANGPVASAYDTPGAFMAFSQGVGVGIRPYDGGGVGALFDLGGDDRYEAGEFSQGGGYYWGVGLLLDEAGDDLYYGNRYAQGFAVHQSFGMLADLAGDDIYWSTTAAGQGAAWDQSVAMLFDGDGDDLYRAQSLSQGAAAQQSRASLHDVSGDDAYRAQNDVAQGAAGDNAYHYRAADPIHSLGVLIDDGGSDRYSTALVDGDTRVRGEAGGAPNGRGVAGIAIDRR